MGIDFKMSKVTWSRFIVQGGRNQFFFHVLLPGYIECSLCLDGGVPAKEVELGDPVLPVRNCTKSTPGVAKSPKNKPKGLISFNIL